MELNKYIDHTLLKPNASQNDIEQLCLQAKQYHFMSVCVNPTWVNLAANLLKDSDVKVCTVIGFPLGASTTATKVFETANAIANGANEIDMVVNIADLQANKIAEVVNEINAIKEACKGNTLKVIVETCLLNEQQKINACLAVSQSNADFIKTSTGFSTGGATIEDVALFKKHLNPSKKIKASGGIKTQEQMLKMIEAGANRIGTSNGVKLME